MSGVNSYSAEPDGLFSPESLGAASDTVDKVLQREGDRVQTVSERATTAVQGGATLRAWQAAALSKYLSAQPQDFMAVATPGAGKTTFALRIAAELLVRRIVDKVTVVAPTEHLKHQWAAAAARAGIALDANFSNSTGVTSPDYQGVVVTYAQVSSHPFRHAARTNQYRTLVILDEIHHAGDSKSWGEAVEDAFDGAIRRLALTGTPFRSDDSKIPFVTYTPNEDGVEQSRADYTYGYAQALADKVVRPVVFLAYSGEARWQDNAGEEYTARLGEPLSAEQTTRAWRTALDPRGEWIPAVLAAANTRLHQLRESGMEDAGGLVIATDQERARAYAGLLEKITGRAPTVVLSDDPGSSERIESFANSKDEWMVAVRMVSEGVDVPRLAVGVYATSASTPLYFAQAIGRFVRSRRPGETASVFLPSVPVLLELAAQLEAQRDHVIGKPHRPKEGWDDELVAEANQQKDEKTELEPTYVSLGAQAELDQLIFDGASYGTPTASNSEAEGDYLGLPGLLNAEQMRDLLQQRYRNQLDNQAAGNMQSGGKDGDSDARGGPAAGEGPGQRLSAADLPRLRKELNALVSINARRSGKPHGTIHNDLRRECGGPAVPMATAEQIQQRITRLRQWK